MRRALLLLVPLSGLFWLGPVSSRAPVIVKQREPLRLPRAIPALDILAQVEKTVDFAGLDDPKTSLIEALDQLSRIHRLTFDVKEKAFVAEEVADVLKQEIANPNPVPPMKARLGFVLKKILERVQSKSGAIYLVRGDRIEITTLAAFRAEVGRKDGVSPLPIVNVVADRRPLDECLAQMADQAERNIVFDPRLSDFARTGITACMLNTPFESALFLVTEMADLSFVRMDNNYYVTSRERAATLKGDWQRQRPAPVAEANKEVKTAKSGK
jgi:hypothetical protein